jgi:hypothetical protein
MGMLKYQQEIQDKLNYIEKNKHKKGWVLLEKPRCQGRGLTPEKVMEIKTRLLNQNPPVKFVYLRYGEKPPSDMLEPPVKTELIFDDIHCPTRTSKGAKL